MPSTEHPIDAAHSVNSNMDHHYDSSAVAALVTTLTSAMRGRGLDPNYAYADVEMAAILHLPDRVRQKMKRKLMKRPSHCFGDPKANHPVALGATWLELLREANDG